MRPSTVDWHWAVEAGDHLTVRISYTHFLDVQRETFSPHGSNRNKSKMSRGTGQLRLSSQRQDLEASFIQDHGPHLGLHRLNTDGLNRGYNI